MGHIDYTHEFEFKFLNGTEETKIKGYLLFDGEGDVRFKLLPPFEDISKELMDHIMSCINTWNSINKASGKITQCHLDLVKE